MKAVLRFFQKPEIQLYGVLLALVLLSYSVVLPQLGLYGDDPAFLYTYHRYGPEGFHDYLGGFRPFAPWIYRLITPLFQETIWAYHAFLLVLRWLMPVLFYQVLALTWPERKRIFTWAACLLAVYPGFMQQAMPLEFCLHFATFCLLMVSLIFMIRSIQQPRAFISYTIASLVTGLSMFGIEYFTGLELLRPVILGALIWRQNSSRRWQKLALHWLPYLLLYGGYLIWRGLVFQSVYYQPTLLNDLRSNPWEVLVLIWKVTRDIFTTGLHAWGIIFQIPRGGVTLLIYLALLAICIVFLGLFFFADSRRYPAESITADEGWGRKGLLLGLFAMLAGGIPVWAAGLQVTLSYSWDRTTLPFMAGACLGMAGLVAVFVKPRHIPAVLAVLIAFIVGFQFQQMNTYRREWDITRDYFWQLVWRAPQLEQDTLIITHQPPTQYLTDNSLTGLLNWIYDPENHAPNARYKLFDMAYRVNHLPSYEPNTPVTHLTFSGNTSQTVVIYATPGTCLRVLAPEDALLPHLPETLLGALPLSNTAQILPGESAQPPAFLGPEPVHGWCYAVSKAGLAAQQGDWAEVTRIYKQTRADGLSPLSPAELTVFIKGYAQTGDVDSALALSDQAIQIDTAIRPLVCQVWRNLRDEITTQTAIDEWMNGQKCP
ncbi:MAG: hypothetical protein JW987_11455 [Anaerolineaceae bacterium]|nr:hypothetical protein [Anaerolineaceae bacterium]